MITSSTTPDRETPSTASAASHTAALGRLQVRLDPWQPEFGPELSGVDESLIGGHEVDVEVDIERSVADWAPINPSDRCSSGEIVCFVDGVRRLEARVTVKLDEQYSYGAFGAYGVGAVEIDTEKAHFERAFAGRVLALSASEQPASAVDVAPGLSYIPVRVTDPEPEAPIRAIHGEMRKAEEMLARELAAREDRLVVVDGPLTFEESVKGSAVGYIKRVIKTYLPPLQLGLLPRLQPGQRTPIFALRGSTRFSRLAWFLRLSQVRKGDSEFSGIVRLEVAEAVGIEKARSLADACGSLLPSLKGRRALDRRAPQNLLPIGALEALLRHKLGDERIIRRRIESFLTREAG